MPFDRPQGTSSFKFIKPAEKFGQEQKYRQSLPNLMNLEQESSYVKSYRIPKIKKPVDSASNVDVSGHQYREGRSSSTCSERLSSSHPGNSISSRGHILSPSRSYRRKRARIFSPSSKEEESKEEDDDDEKSD